MAQIAAVAVDKATPQFDREYSYLVPDSLPVQVGCRVTVPFGKDCLNVLSAWCALYDDNRI